MLLLVGYLMMIRTAERRNAAGAVLCFLEGAYLAMLCFSWEIPVFPLAFLGGVGLYHASAGILPEPVSIRNALFSAGGFLAGVFLFSPLL